MASDETSAAIAVVGGYPPGSVGGGPIILRNLLAELGRERLVVFTTQRGVDSMAEAGGELLEVRHETVRPLVIDRRGLRRPTRLLHLGLIPLVASRIARRSSGPILAFPSGGQLGSELFVAAWLASVMTRRRLVVYELDQWEATIGPGSGLHVQLLERFLHRVILRRAACVFAVSRAMSARLAARSGGGVEVLPAATAERPPRDLPAVERVVLYGGAIYGAQADAVVRAAEAASVAGLTMVLHTGAARAELDAVGLPASAEVRPPLDAAAFRERMVRSSVLLLPLSFADEQRDVVRTSFPSKTAEYLATGTPILVHAPADAAVTLAARAGGWATVVSEPDVAALAQALQTTATDPSVRMRLRAAAAVALDRDFSLSSARRTLFEALFPS